MHIARARCRRPVHRRLQRVDDDARHGRRRHGRPVRKRSKPRRHAAQRFVRSDARALRRVQQGVRQALAGEAQPGSHDRAVARRRRRQARAVIDGLKADVVTLALAYDIDQISELAGLMPRRLAIAAAEQQLPVPVDDRVPGPQGQSEGNQGLERPGEGRRRGHHAEPEDLRRRPLQLPGRLGLRTAAQQQRRSQGPRVRRRLLQERAGARFGRPRLDDHVRATRNRRRAAGLGKRSPAGDQGARPDEVEMVVPSVSILAEPPVTVLDKNAEATARRKSPRPTSNTCTRRSARRSPPSTTTARASRNYVDQEVLKQFPEVTLFSVNEVFGSWKEAQAKHFNDGGIFDSIYAPQ